jgi:hypothetical protein
VAKGESKPNARTQAQGGGNDNNKKKKKACAKPTASQSTHRYSCSSGGWGRGGPRGDKRPHQLFNSDIGNTKCSVHNSTCHTALECREIKKLAKQFCDKMQQQCQDGAPSRQREGKQKVDPQEEKDVEMEFQDARRALKAVYGHSDSESNDNERCKAFHVMFGGFWNIMFRCIIKTLRREIMVVAPAPKAAPHRKWVESLIGFDASNCPKSMADVG